MTGTEIFYLFYIGMPLAIGTVALIGLWAFEWAERKAQNREHNPAE